MKYKGTALARSVVIHSEQKETHTFHIGIKIRGVLFKFVDYCHILYSVFFKSRPPAWENRRRTLVDTSR